MNVRTLGALDWWRPDTPGEPGRVAAGEPAPVLEGRFAFRALVVYLVVMVAAPQSFVPALAGLRPALVAAATASLAYLFGRSSKALPAVARARERILAGALFGWAVLTVPLSLWPGGSLKAILDPFLPSLVLFWLLGVLATSGARLRVLAWTLTLCAVPMAVTGLRHFLDGTYAAGRITGYANGLAGNPNDLALLLVVITPLTISLVKLESRMTYRLLLAGVLALEAAAIVATFSRGGFLALTSVALLSLLRLVRWRATGAVLAVVVVLGLGATMLPAGYGARLSTITDMNADPTGSAQARWQDSVAAVTFISAHPLVGAGIGLDYLALNEVRGTTWESVHDVYLKIAVELGVVGLALYAALLATSLWTARRAEVAAERAGLPDVSVLAGGVRIGLTAFAIAAFFYPVPYHPYFYLLAGLGLASQGIVWSGESGRAD